MHTNILKIRTSPGSNVEQAPANFFLQRFIEDNEGLIEEIDPGERLFEQLDTLLQEERNRLEENLDEFEQDVSENLSEVLFSPIANEFSFSRREVGTPFKAWKFRNDENEVVFIHTPPQRRRPARHRYGGRPQDRRETTLLLIADGQDNISNFIGYFEKRAHEIESIVGDFINLDDVKNGADLVREYFEEQSQGDYVTDWYVDETEDEFEAEVYNVVKNYTGISLQNVNVESSVGESPEYDVVTLPLGEFGSSYAIEAKNYDREHVEEDDMESTTLRYKLITQPKEEAERVDLKLITVVKGLDDDQYENLKRHADPSNVILLNENNYKNRLEELMTTDSFKSLSRNLQR